MNIEESKGFDKRKQPNGPNLKIQIGFGSNVGYPITLPNTECENSS